MDFNVKELSRLQEENRQLKKAVEELSILNDIATAINSTLSLEKIVHLIVQKCVKFFQVEQTVVMLLEESDTDQRFHTMVRQMDTSVSRLPYRLDTHLTGWMLKYQQPLLVNDLAEDERFAALIEEDCPITSLLSVPLVTKGRIIGVITAFNKKLHDGFTPEDQRLLSIISTQSAQVIENARLLEKEQELIRVGEELRMAYDIQVNLLPSESPNIPGLDIAGKSIPAKSVGGDYFDFLTVDDRYWIICLGDVTGKGLPAALLMSNLQAIVHSQKLTELSPAKHMKNTNTLIFENTSDEKFVTMFYGILDLQTGEFIYCNAGHDYPFLLNGENSDPIRLKTGGLVLGFLPDYDYQEERFQFSSGSTLVIYSDGIPEAKNSKDEEFGEERLLEVLLKNKHLTSEKLLDRIVAATREFTGETPQSDDITSIVIKAL